MAINTLPHKTCMFQDLKKPKDFWLSFGALILVVVVVVVVVAGGV